MGNVAYFSSVTSSTRRFVKKLGLPTARVPLPPKDEPLRVTDKYILIMLTHGGGSIKRAVPKQIIRFLNDPDSRVLCRSVISSGNVSLDKAYYITGGVTATRLRVPYMYKFELSSTPRDVSRVREGLE